MITRAGLCDLRLKAEILFALSAPWRATKARRRTRAWPPSNTERFPKCVLGTAHLFQEQQALQTSAGHHRHENRASTSCGH